MYGSTILYGIFALIVTYFIRRYIRVQKFAKYVDKLPGDKAYPIVGTLHMFFGVKRDDLYIRRREITEKYKPLFRTWAGSQPWVHLTKPEHLEVVMNNMVQISKSDFYNNLRPWLGDGLLTSKGAKWHRNRKLITPTFHFQILDNFMDVFVEKSQMLVEQLSSKADGKVFDIYPFITHCALDIICETAMGVQIGAMAGKNTQYVEAVYQVSRLTTERSLKPWLMYDFIYNLTSNGKKQIRHLEVLHGFTNKVIQERKGALRNKTERSGKASAANSEDLLLGKKRRMAFLDLLIEASKNGTILSDRDIREEVDTFMFEGHDTTTAGICWGLFLLGNHPEIQEQVYEELQTVLGDKKGPLTTNDLNELKTLERVIKESLRLYPSVPIILRELAEDIEVDGYVIPSGVMAVLHIYDVHRIEKIFPDPERFDPDRFLPEVAKNRHPYSYIPFSAGPRNCIGQKFAMLEEKTFLAYILKNYRVRSVETQATIKLSADLILKPQGGLKLMLEPRLPM